MITKRILGLTLISGGLLVVAGAFAIDWLGVGNFQGVGPAQRLALAGAGLLVLVGITLLPFGNRPA